MVAGNRIDPHLPRFVAVSQLGSNESGEHFGVVGGTLVIATVVGIVVALVVVGVVVSGFVVAGAFIVAGVAVVAGVSVVAGGFIVAGLTVVTGVFVIDFFDAAVVIRCVVLGVVG